MNRGRKRTTTVERRFNRRRYAELLAAAALRLITSSEELEHASQLAEPLLKKGEARTPEENALCELLLKLIDDYQEQRTIIPDLRPTNCCKHCSPNRASVKPISSRSSARVVVFLMLSTASAPSARNRLNDSANTSVSRLPLSFERSGAPPRHG